MALSNKIIFLIGYPAVGKLTIGKILAERMSARLIDNHAVNNSIFQIVRANGAVNITENVSKYTSAVRQTVIDAIEELSNPQESFIFTNVLIDKPNDAATFNKIKTLAEKRGNDFIPVIISCDANDLIKRVSSPDREKNLKLTNVDVLKSILESKKILPINHPNLLKVDSSHHSKEEVANIIAEHTTAIGT
jgi:shikimate kinase